MTPEVSVVIPAYNSEAYIAQALESVLSQTHHNLEVILIDDASVDSTVKIARSFNDKRLKIIVNQQNSGVSYSRNRGIQAAKGTWIALLDSDDWYAPERLEVLLSAAKRENADFVADDLNLIRDRDSQPWSTLLRENRLSMSSTKTIDATDFVISDRPHAINKKRNWSFGYTKPLMKREFLLDRGINYDEAIDVGEDFVLYLECLRQKAKFVLVPQAYYFYRTRVTSLSTRKPTEYLAESCDIMQIFIDRELEANCTSQLLTVLYDNLALYNQRLEYYRVLEAIKQRKIVKSILLIAENPYTLGTIVDKLIGIAIDKIIFLVESKSRNQIDFNVASVKE